MRFCPIARRSKRSSANSPTESRVRLDFPCWVVALRLMPAEVRPLDKCGRVSLPPTIWRVARLTRFFVPGLPLHIVQRGNNRNAIFGCPADYTFLYDVLTRLTRTHGVAVHAYVLMTNHLHLLATPTLASSVPKAMQALGRLYVAHFNWRHGRTGTLWEGRYRATIVDHDRYFLACMRYIELNPVRAQIVGYPGDYRWSSFRGNAFGASDALVTQHAMYAEMGASSEARQAAYRTLFASALSNQVIEDIRDATEHAWALGSTAFCDDVARRARRARRAPMGRPPKGHRAEENQAKRDGKGGC